MENSQAKFTEFIQLPGSSRAVPQGKISGATDLNKVIEVTVRVRRKNAIDEQLKKIDAGEKALDRSAYGDLFGANPADLQRVAEYAHKHNLAVVNASIPRRSVILRGTVQNFSAAFKVYLSDYIDINGKPFRGRAGSISIPAELNAVVTGVFGLDDRQQAKPMFRQAKSDTGHFLKPEDVTVSYSPGDVAKAYNYPQDVNGAGQSIALIELGGGYRSADLDTYFASLGMQTPTIIAQSVDGALNSPSTPNSDDGEVVLDIEVAATVASGAQIIVYFAPNTDQGFLDAITTAIHDDTNKPFVISISWASSEDGWPQQVLDSFEEAFQSAKALGITILCAAGDHGSSNGETDGSAHVSYPASSAYVLACGGTSLTSTSEVVWNENDGWATGGGISEVMAVPDYQTNVTLPASVNPGAGTGRGLPDIAGNADQRTGYNIFVDGEWVVSGGTSAVAPLVAGLIALANEKLGRNVGFIHPKIYAAPTNAFRDITDGENNTSQNGGYTAVTGWDACTGMGVPLGDLIQYL